MLSLLSNNPNILFYLKYILNINSASIEEQENSSCIELGFGNTNFSSKANESVQEIYSSQRNKIGVFECGPLDITPYNTETVIYNGDKLFYSEPSKASDSSEYNIQELPELKEVDSSEISEEIDVETIDPCDDNIPNKLISLEPGNNEEVYMHPQNAALQKYFHKGIFKPYMASEGDVTCSKSEHPVTPQYYYNTPQSADIRHGFKEKVIDLSTTRRFDKRELDQIVHEDGGLTHSCAYPKGLYSDKKKQPCDLNTLTTTSDVKSILFNSETYTSLKRENILNTKTTPLSINDKINPLKRRYDMSSSYLKDLLSKTPITSSTHAATVVEDNSNYVPDIFQSVNSMECLFKGKKSQTKQLTHILPVYNTLHDVGKYSMEQMSKQSYHTDGHFNPTLHLKAKKESFFKVYIQKHEETHADGVSLEKIEGGIYNFKFCLNDMFISWSFELKWQRSLFLEFSENTIKAMDFEHSERLLNISTERLKYKNFEFILPTFHKVNIIIPHQIDYFRIYPSLNEYGIIQTLTIYIYNKTAIKTKKVYLKCPRIQAFNELISKLLETKFPIYKFDITWKNTPILFSRSNYFEVMNTRTINEYIKNLLETPFDIKIGCKQKYKSLSDLYEQQRKDIKRNKLSWESSVSLLYEIYLTFNINIKKIEETVLDDSKSMDIKKAEINDLLNQIIQKWKINFTVLYPRKTSIDFEREAELISFYIFCRNELLRVFEWWNKYIFVAEEVPYLD